MDSLTQQLSRKPGTDRKLPAVANTVDVASQGRDQGRRSRSRNQVIAITSVGRRNSLPPGKS